MDAVECGPCVVQGGKQVMAARGTLIFRFVKKFFNNIFEFLHYLISFTTSDWIIQYLTSWY